jgi:CBS domain containing-hemolysin-like protein
MRTLRQAIFDELRRQHGARDLYIDTLRDTNDILIVDGRLNLAEFEDALEMWIAEGVREFARVKGVEVNDVLRKMV